MGSSSLQSKTSRMLAELDTIRSATRTVVLMELDEAGECTLYQRICFQNPSGEPLEALPGIGGFAAIPFYSVGGEEATVEFGEYLPNGIERHFTAKLQTPVPPGEWIDIVMVGERVTKYKAREIEGGLWRFGPVEGETNLDMNCALGLKLPKGGRITTVEPEPDDTRSHDAPMLIWQESLAGLEEFEITVEYRLGATE